MDCLNDLDLEYDTWSERLYRPLGDKRYPLSGSLELTPRCNLQCVHCYINEQPGCRAAMEEELSTAGIKQILDQVADAGCLFLLLTGGEPLLRADFPELYLYARRRGLIITLFTNATLLTPRMIEMFVSAPPSKIEVSVYGATRETYEAVTRIPGSYDRFIHGLELLQQSGLNFSLKSVILSLNRHELAAMQVLAQRFAIRLRYDGTVWPRLDGTDSVFRFRLSMQEMLDLDREDPERMASWSQVYQLGRGLTLRSERVFHCGAGFRSFHIDSSGKLSVCMMARQTTYDVNALGFDTAWQKLGALRTLKRSRDTACLRCTAAGVCSQCPGWSQLAYGDNESIYDYVCQLAKEREQQINIYDKMIVEKE